MERAIIDKIVVHPVVDRFQGVDILVKAFQLTPERQERRKL